MIDSDGRKGRKADGGNNIVKPVAKALKVLIAICTERHPPGLNDLIALTGLPKTTVFRYVSTLRAAGLIDVSPGGDRFHPSLGLWLLGQAAGVHERLRSICLPVMLSLQKEFNETVNLGTLRGRQVVYIEIVESERSLRMQARTGALDPIHSTALGKALLAFMPEERWPSYLNHRLERYTGHTITDKVKLREQLREARILGAAYDRGENEEGALCVAVPLMARNGSPLAALSISAPAHRFEDKAAMAVAALKKGAAAIEAALQDAISFSGTNLHAP